MGNKCSACCRCACCTNGKSHGHISSSGSVYTKRFVDLMHGLRWNSTRHLCSNILVGHLGARCGKTKQNIFFSVKWHFSYFFFRFVFIHLAAVDDMWCPKEIQTVWIDNHLSGDTVCYLLFGFHIHLTRPFLLRFAYSQFRLQHSCRARG